MGKSILVLMVLIASLDVASSVSAQSQANNPLVGTWDRYGARDAKGVESGTPGVLYLGFTPDGHFFITGIRPGRNSPDKALNQMTREELLILMQGALVRRGRYTLAGNKLTLSDEADLLNPSLKGNSCMAVPCNIRFEKGEVILDNPANGFQARWRRVK